MLTVTDTDLLKNHLSFWKNLSNDQQQYLLDHTNLIHYTKGTVLHYGETDCLGVLFMKSGTLRTYMLSEEGREITLYRLEANDLCILSASCILDTITFDVSITAETDCNILQISPAAFSRLTNENIYVECFSYQFATKRFSNVMQAMQELLFVSFDKRLVSFLLTESKRETANRLHITHEQIAKYLGTAREVVSRKLKSFSDKGYIRITRGTIEILDFDSLNQLLL